MFSNGSFEGDECVCSSRVLRLVISQNGRALHIVSQHQFLDSPEWFGVSTDEFFQVSATAIEDSRVLIWHRDKLKLTIMGDQFLQAVFDHILGRDVVKKLMQPKLPQKLAML
ncbi:popeye domain-containing 2 isoform X2 [Cherax quadricarinatus]|uniref:popeye domain-containing 2 isoform X2 n=1 Tax=Cherax quadricarinatus TaxID=27406 RepID=UPI00387E2694